MLKYVIISNYSVPNVPIFGNILAYCIEAEMRKEKVVLLHTFS